MEVPPPPKPGPKRRSPVVIVFFGVVVFVLVVSGVIVVHGILAPGGIRGLDNQFGDQHLKTAVALIELHKVRFGKYPGSLSDLKFTGQWDQIALQSLRCYPCGSHGILHRGGDWLDWQAGPEDAGRVL